MKKQSKKMLVRLNADLAVSPRVYRMIQLASRVAWDNSPEWLIREYSAGILRLILDDLHVYTRCVQRGITREEYEREALERVRSLKCKLCEE